MTRTVHKFALAYGETLIPIGGEPFIRHVAVQNDKPTVWIEHDPAERGSTLTLLLVGTGYPVPEYKHFVGTFFDGPFVWHVYRV